MINASQTILLFVLFAYLNNMFDLVVKDIDRVMVNDLIQQQSQKR